MLRGHQSRPLPALGEVFSLPNHWYAEDTPPVFILADRGSDGYALPAKAATESMIRLPLADHKEESSAAYTDGFQAYKPLDEQNTFGRKYIVHSDGEYVDEDVRIDTSGSHAPLMRRWLSPHRGISKARLTPYFRAFHLRRKVFRKPRKGAMKTILETAL